MDNRDRTEVRAGTEQEWSDRRPRLITGERIWNRGIWEDTVNTGVTKCHGSRCDTGYTGDTGVFGGKVV